MKILFNCLTLEKGGAERVINLLSNRFIEKNDIMIVTHAPTNVDYEFNNKIDINHLVDKKKKIGKYFRKISIPLLFRFKKTILEYNPDVIISFLPEPSFKLLTLKLLFKSVRNIPTIVSVRNDPNVEYGNPIYYYIMKKLFPIADCLVLQTNDSKQYFYDKIHVNGVVIHNPVSEKFIKNRYTGIRDKIVVAVGRLEEQKNYKLMIDAFELFNKQYQDYCLYIYGDGNQKDLLKKYIKEKKMQDKVFLMGIVDNIETKIFKASVFVMSSDYEGMPNSLLEAACIGVPCVSTDCPCGGPREILKKGECGVLVPVNDSKSLAEGISKMIEDEGFASSCSKKANENSIYYSIEEIEKQWMDCIKKVIKRSN